MQVFNPFLPSWEYLPDPEPHVFGERVYLYGSHDRFNGISFCLNDYVCWSAPVADLSDWRYEGVIYRKNQDGRKYRGFINSLFASDVCRGKDGRYYLYYFIGYNNLLSVAVCDEPAARYQFLDFVKYKDGSTVGSKHEPLMFDPGVFTDEDGSVYLYSGFGPPSATPFMKRHQPTVKGAMVFELDDDMVTVKGELEYIGVPAKRGGFGTGFEGHEFFEASSLRKIEDRYYFIYSSYLGHELCYAVAESPKGPFSFGGTLVSNGDIGMNGHTCPKDAADFTGNTHGSLLAVRDEFYVFYHRQTNRHQFSRQTCAEKLIRRIDGGFDQAERTSCGLNGGPLSGRGTYEARIACRLTAKGGNRFYSIFRGLRAREPYFTQTGKDREEHPDQYIANFRDGCAAGFKYFMFKNANTLSVRVKGRARGTMSVTNDTGQVAVIAIEPSQVYRSFSAPLLIEDGVHALYFTFFGKGALAFKDFTVD